ncbi:MAG: hypothetical protein KDD11_04430, partial [Acidobacteria bacterium]|nr:hypothetical protein [Acidobacteriota bacterium]
MHTPRPTTRRQSCTLSTLIFAASFVATAAAETHTVQLVDHPPYVRPLVMEVQVGDTVTWKNTGPELVHTVIDEALLLFSDDI